MFGNIERVAFELRERKRTFSQHLGKTCARYGVSIGGFRREVQTCKRRGRFSLSSAYAIGRVDVCHEGDWEAGEVRLCWGSCAV